MPVSSDLDDPTTEPAPTQWYDRPEAMVAAGVLGLVAIGLLAFAVFQTSRHSTAPFDTNVPPMSTTTSSPQRGSAKTTTTTTTTYTTLTTTPWTSSTPPEPPPPETATREIPTETTTGTTTLSVPYPTSTTPRNFV